MKMGRLEKLFVNSPSHTRSVARHAEKMLRLVEFQPAQKYLDVGCGNGEAPIHLAREFGLNVTGIDVDPDQILAAKESSKDLSNARFLVVDGTHLPFSDGEFDFVATNKTTHHIPQWEDALAEMTRVLKPGGHFLYADLVSPGWMDAIGKKVVGKSWGYPTARALGLFVEKNDLSKIHLSRSWFHYETVCRRRG